ncbi:hypothetical protein K2Y00_02410 [Patescibacteria group bacterium]|nr:hypothetical protein [Patescibacteria group bacterium]
MRTIEELSRIVHDTRVELAAEEPFAEAFTRQVLKKHTEPRQYHRIQARIMANVVKKILETAAEEGRAVERVRQGKPGKPATAVSPYVYSARAQEDILRTAITLLSNPPSRLDRHPEGFQEAWLERALQKMRQTV